MNAFRDTIRAEVLPSKEIVLQKYKEALPELYRREETRHYRERLYDKVRSLWKRYSKKAEKEKQEKQ